MRKGKSMKLTYELNAREVEEAVVLWMKEKLGIEVKSEDVSINSQGEAEVTVENVELPKGEIVEDPHSPPLSPSSPGYRGPTYRG